MNHPIETTRRERSLWQRIRPSKAVGYGATLLALYLVWHLAAESMGRAVLPGPGEVFLACAQAAATVAFWTHFLASALRAVAAMALAFGLGFPLGVAMGGSRTVDALISPLVFLTYPIPKIVLLPVAFLLLGLGDTAKVAVIALILGYQVLVTARDGVKAVNGRYLDSVRSLGATRWELYREVLLPAGLPHGFTALRLNSGVSVAVLFFVESFATQTGLGYLIMDNWGRMDYPAMFTGIVGMSGLGVLLYESVGLAESSFCAWTRAGRGR